jgi:hypothetical protein
MPIRLRFVTSADLLSALIRAEERTTIPFIPSHVEAVTPDGLYLGAHDIGGVAARPPGYDRAALAHELFLDLPATEPQATAFHKYLARKIGAPYDWKAILDFVDPFADLHDNQHLICSALQTLALRACGWFAAPLVCPAHQISPRDLLLTLSGRVPVPTG